MTERSAGAMALRSLLEKVAQTPIGDPAPQPGDRIGRYELVRVLGQGGFGIVYEARDRQLDRAVALKVLRRSSDDEPRAFEWFEREARAMARLSHANIVTLHDFGDHEGRPYLVLALLHGKTLAEVLRDGPLTQERSIAIGLAIAVALDHAHRAGVIHLDLKPSNVFLGNDDQVTVLDFGLARLVSPRSSDLAATTGSLDLRGAGTPAFMAPEQDRGMGDARADVFAAGLLLYAMLTGELPFALSAGSVERVLRPAGVALRSLAPGLPKKIARVIVRALAEDPDARFADGGALLDALRVAARRSRRRLVLGGVLAVVAAAAVIAIAMVANDRHRTGHWNVSVPAKSVWTETRIEVHANQTIEFHATGEVCTKPAESCAGPDGQARISDYVLPNFPSTNLGALVGRIGGHVFVVGAESTLEAPDHGRLWLGINDRDGSNNGGSGFDVTVDLR